MTYQLPPGSCAEELAQAPWRKSTWSESANGCIESAPITGHIGVRDSKDPHGPVQLYTASQWTRFVSAVRTGEFDL